MVTTSQKHAELKRLGKEAAKTIYDMLRLSDEILSDHEYVDQFGGEPKLIDMLEKDEFAHFGGDPSLSAMLRAFRANPKETTWKEYRFNVRAMIELAREQEDKGRREARKKQTTETLEAVAVVVADAARKHAGNVNKAVEVAERQARAVPGFRDIVPDLIRHAIQERIYDVRKNDNAQQRDSQFAESPPMAYCIGGTVLARIRGEQLEAIAAAEEKAATGHSFNARICRLLAGIVKPGQTVKQALSADELQKIMAEDASV